MTTKRNGNSILIEHTNNSADSLQPVTWSMSLTHSSMPAGAALASVETISGIMRPNVATCYLVGWFARLSVPSGSVDKKAIRLLLFSKANIPVSTPSIGVAVTYQAADHPYLIGVIDLATGAAWNDTTTAASQVTAWQQGTTKIPLYNADDTVGTSIYGLAVNQETSSWTPASSEVLEIDLYFAMN